MKKLLTLALLTMSLSTFLVGQQVIREQLQWQEAPTRYQIGEATFEQWRFDEAVFGDGAPTLPYWVKRIPVSGPGRLAVTISDVRWEAFNKTTSDDDARLNEELQIATSVVRENGQYIAKLSCTPIRKIGDTYQRATAFVLQTALLPQTELRGGPPTNSALSDGDIYKIAIPSSGVYKLTYAFLKDELKIDNFDNIDPRNIQVLGNRGGIVPYDVDFDRDEDVVENPVFISGEEDGSFDGNDYLLMYANGPDRWQYDASDDRFTYESNIYDERNYYFIKIAADPGLRISEQANVSATASTDEYDALIYYGEDNLNALHEIEDIATGTGQKWYTDFFRFARDKDFTGTFDFTGINLQEPVKIQAEMGLRAKVRSRFFLDFDNSTLQSTTAPAVRIQEDNEIFDNLAGTARLRDEITFNSINPSILLRYPHPGGGEQSSGWLDYIILQPRKQLQLPTDGSQLRFQDSRTLSNPSTSFEISGGGGDWQVWDITNPVDARQQAVNNSGNSLSFGANTDNQLKTFIAFQNNSTFPEAEVVGKVAPQNLHAIDAHDMIVLYHPEFEEAALRLAEHRRTHSGLSVVSVTTEQVYNEYASGRAEPSAIRDFVKEIFDRDGSLRYLLLVGDGSFDNRDVYGLGSSFVPIFQNDRNHELYGYPADDFFGIFSTNLTDFPLADDLSIGIGRIPCNSPQQANTIAAKIVDYDTKPEYMLDWRTRMMFLGDDEDGGTHSDDADLAANTVANTRDQFSLKKLYFDLFPQERTAAGDRFPVVEEELDRGIFKGNVITTYLGHGGPRGWAQERVLDIPAIRNWRNLDRLSLFLTATCTFGDYDNSAFVSAGEELILNDRGGAIALLTTTRPVFANRNSALTNATLRTVLTQEADGQWPALGDVIRIAKNSLSRPTPDGYHNERKFMLMGDPAQRIALPTYQVATTAINGKAIENLARDTISSLEQVTITGQVLGLDGQTLTNFNGLVYPTIFDKVINATTLRNDPLGSPELTYSLQDRVLFRGKAEVVSGEFSFSFVVPKDINYNFGDGRIVYYAADLNQQIDAGGSEDRFVIGGSNPEGTEDDTPPLVEVFMNSTDFVSGSIVDPDATLVVRLSDENGINVAGNSIGHDLEGFLNEDTQNSLLLNDFYEADANDFTKGQVRFPLRDLEPGTYNLKVRAWDVANNVGEGFTEFVVAGDGKIALERVLNYPNPFTDRTCFQFDHSVAGEELEVLIQVYTISGRQVKTISSTIATADGALRQDDCIEWDGRDDYGDQLARGVYLYKVRVRTNSGLELSGESEFEKLVILK